MTHDEMVCKIRDLGLTAPKGWCYRETAAYGHFGRSQFPWERTDRVAVLRDAAGQKGQITPNVEL